MSSRAIEAARAFVRIYADDAQLRKTLAGMKSQMEAVSDAFSGIGTNVVFAGIVAGGTALAQVAGNAERTAISFEVMLGSADAAKSMLDQIYALGKESSFGASEFMQAGQVLLNFGASADSVLPTLRMLGDVAAGDSEKLQRLTLAFAQVSAAGKLSGQDNLQFINAGFAPLQEISKKTGESMAELRKRMEAGGISAAEVAEAFRSATSAGGRFHGMTQRLAGSTIGIFMTLKDEVVLLAQDMGKHLLPAVNNVLSAVRWLVSQFSGWGKLIVYTGVAIGTFIAAMKAATLATVAWGKAQAMAAAFSGPKGWLLLAGGIAMSAAAVAAVDLSMKDVVATTSETHEPLKVAAQDFDTLAMSAADTKKALKDAQQATDDVNRSIERMRDPVESAIAATKEFQDAMAASGKFGMVVGKNPLVEQFREFETGYTESLRKIQDEIRVLGGTATEAGLELERMAKAGVDPAKLKELEDLIAKRDRLQKAKEGKEYFAQKQEEMQRAADEVRQAFESVQDAFAREQARLRPLIENGLLSQTDADKFLRKNPKFARLMNGGLQGEFTKGSTGVADLKTTGGALITDVLNQTGTVEQNQLAQLQKLVMLAEQQVDESKKKPKAYKV